MTFDAKPDAVFVASAGAAATSGGAGMSLGFAEGGGVAAAAVAVMVAAEDGALVGASLFFGELHPVSPPSAIDATRVAVINGAIAREGRW